MFVLKGTRQLMVVVYLPAPLLLSFTMSMEPPAGDPPMTAFQLRHARSVVVPCSYIGIPALIRLLREAAARVLGIMAQPTGGSAKRGMLFITRAVITRFLPERLEL